jgi:hypothetical protein
VIVAGGSVISVSLQAWLKRVQELDAWKRTAA